MGLYSDEVQSNREMKMKLKMKISGRRHTVRHRQDVSSPTKIRTELLLTLVSLLGAVNDAC